MQTLLDIGDLTEDVTVGGVTLRMRGLTVHEIFMFLVRYPSLRTLFDKESSAGGDAGPRLSQDDLMAAAPQAVYEAVAMCNVDLPRDKAGNVKPDALAKASNRVRTLAISDQLKLVNCFFNLTFSDGVGPFVEEFKKLMSRFGELKEGTVDAAASATNSREEFDDAFRVDTPFSRRGVQHLAKSSDGLH